jgi:hypothetical protein
LRADVLAFHPAASDPLASLDRGPRGPPRRAAGPGVASLPSNLIPERSSIVKKTALWTVCLIALVAALPAFAADRAITNGIDLWRTTSNGTTFVDFKNHPIPAGFFCADSAPFTGRIGWRGIPVATGTAGSLGQTDTIVQRLDDATFNARGVAWTRIQVKALNFQSLRPIQTSCGLFTAKVSLNGAQPITRMRILRENGEGGRFEAPIAVNAKITFAPVGRAAGEVLELTKEVRFPPLPNQRWSSRSGPGGIQKVGMVLVDTDGDGRPDTYLPGTSNFAVGQARGLSKLTDQAIADCHTVDDEGHCVG